MILYLLNFLEKINKTYFLKKNVSTYLFKRKQTKTPVQKKITEIYKELFIK